MTQNPPTSGDGIMWFRNMWIIVFRRRFYSTYFPGFAFSPSSVVSRLGCRVILLFISTAKPVSTLRWIARRTGFFFLPSSENNNKGKGRWVNKKEYVWHLKPQSQVVHLLVLVLSWTWTMSSLQVCFVVCANSSKWSAQCYHVSQSTLCAMEVHVKLM